MTTENDYFYMIWCSQETTSQAQSAPKDKWRCGGLVTKYLSSLQKQRKCPEMQLFHLLLSKWERQGCWHIILQVILWFNPSLLTFFTSFPHSRASADNQREAAILIKRHFATENWHSALTVWSLEAILSRIMSNISEIKDYPRLKLNCSILPPIHPPD